MVVFILTGGNTFYKVPYYKQVGDRLLMKTKTICFRIFNEYTINYLARTLNYKASYLIKVLDNPEKVSDRFKFTATSQLKRTEEELFALVDRAEEKASDHIE